MRNHSFRTYQCDISHRSMGWLRSVGSIKLQVSFAEYRLFYKPLLQKRPVILSILLTKATPYVRCLIYKSEMARNGAFTCVKRLNSFTSVACFIHLCERTHLEIWNDSFAWLNDRIHMCGKAQVVRIRGISHWSTWEDIFIRVKWLFRMLEMTRFHTCVERLNSLTIVTSFIGLRERTHLYV